MIDTKLAVKTMVITAMLLAVSDAVNYFPRDIPMTEGIWLILVLFLVLYLLMVEIMIGFGLR